MLGAVVAASCAALQEFVRLRRMCDDFASRQNRPRQLRRSQADLAEKYTSPAKNLRRAL
jgi:acyl carrier protein phosphodiesterase